MAARRRAQERDFNRRRRLILDRGIDLAYNQKDTAFGECLLKLNVREGTRLERRQMTLARQQEQVAAHRDQEMKRFVALRDQATREPTLLLERMPSAEQYPDFVDMSLPRFMRPMEARQSKVPEFSTLSVFQAVKKRKRNPWEEAVRSSVQFRPTLCPCPRLSRSDTEKLTADWAQVAELQSRALLAGPAASAPNRSMTAKPFVASSATADVNNPLGLPSRLNSALHRLARELFDDMPSASVGGLQSTSSESYKSRRSTYTAAAAAPIAAEETPQQSPIFITQMGAGQMKGSELVFDFEQRRSDSRRREKEQLARKQQVDRALTSIYELLDGRRAAGQLHLRSVNSRHRRRKNDSQGIDECEEDDEEEDDEAIGTTCRTAESRRILADARRTRIVTRRRLVRGGGDDEQQLEM